MRRGNRHLVGVVLGGRSGGSRDATMRNLLAENLEKAATKRTVAAITERNPCGRQCRCRGRRGAIAADADGSGPGRRSGRLRIARAARAAPPDTLAVEPSLARGRGRRACRPPQAKPEPAPLTNGRDPDPADRRDPRFVRADEAGPGQDRPGQGRSGEAGLGRRAQPATPSPVRYPPAPCADSAGNLERRRGQG